MRWNVSHKYWIIGGLALVAVGGGLGFLVLMKANSQAGTPNATNDSTRQHYANLYLAAWRQDQAQGDVLTTATLFVPPLVTSLGQQSDRSETEEQLWRIMRDVPTNAVPVVMTIDSVAGDIPDAAIQKSLTLTDTDGMTFTTTSWTPMVAPTNVVNTNQATTSQMGVAVFTAAQPVPWSTLGPLHLVSLGLGDQPRREFVWAEPKLLLQVK